MKPRKFPDSAEARDEISALIETLHRTEQRLEELTAGEVDTVADRTGRTVLLRRAQEQLRHSEAAKQAAILNALPASIALLDTQGRIVSVNEAWRRFADANLLQSPLYGAGLNYLDICGSAAGDDAPEARRAAAGIRSVLAGEKIQFSMEYPCHSPGEQRWFLMTVTPLAANHLHGAVVMHFSITERKETENRIAYLNRVYAMLSSVNTLIVNVHDRDGLFRDVCRIAVDAGGFRMALLAIVDQGTDTIVPLTSAGSDEKLLAAVRKVLSSPEDAPLTLLARAIRDKQVVVSNDSQNDSRVLFIKEYRKSGVRSMAIFPLMVAEDVTGAFALYASEIDFFHEEEMKLLTELTGDISFALDHISKQERLNYLAYYDDLTGLANRTLFLDRVTQYMHSADSSGHKLALFLIDLERFRNINDSLGQPAGDDLLRQVAEWLKSAVGDANLLARLDADHFAVVLPEIRQEGNVARLLEKKMQAFQMHPFHLHDSVVRISFKAGVAIYPDDGADADTLFRNAEAALKKAKERGSHYLFYTQKMTEALAGKLTLENQLHQALDGQQFVLHYQPKVNLASGKVSSAEALIRWNDPRTGLVYPGQFIPILEETGLIHEVGRWALHKAIADYLRWRAAGLVAVRIAVNVSPLQLRHPDFIAEIRRAISIDEHAAAGLELEITESLIMEDVKYSIASLQVIRDMGIHIAIDDFGTGFSSLSYLAKLPVDTLKIDRSFIIDMTAGPEGLALVSTIINLAHSLKLKVVAEGVETEEQWRLLRLLNCDEIQGFLFSKPLPVELFESSLHPLPAVL